MILVRVKSWTKLPKLWLILWGLFWFPKLDWWYSNDMSYVRIINWRTRCFKKFQAGPNFSAIFNNEEVGGGAVCVIKNRHFASALFHTFGRVRRANLYLWSTKVVLEKEIPGQELAGSWDVLLPQCVLILL